MATSGTKTVELDVAEYIEEAFERCGLEVKTGYDARTARRSLNLLLAEWANRGFNRWTLDTEVLPMVLDTATYTLSATTIDIVSAVLRVDATDRDYTLERLSREDWLTIFDKELPGAPNCFYVDRTIVPTLRVWPVPNAAGTYSIVYDRLVRMDDVTASTQTIEVPFRFYPCLAAGLAYYISLKRAPDRATLLKQIYEEEFDRAAMEDRDRASFYILPARGINRI